MTEKQGIKKYLLIITFAILLFTLMQNIPVVLGALGYVYRLFASFTIGLCMAFILNVPLKYIENGIFANKNKRVYRFKREISIVLTLIFVSGIIGILLFLVIPEVISTARMIKDNMPQYTESVVNWITELMERYDISVDLIEKYKIDWNQLGATVGEFFARGNILNKTVDVTAGIFNGVFNALMGIVFAVYILYQKENLGRQINNVFKAFLPNKWREKVLYLSGLSSDIFERFVAGQVLEAIILGCLCFVGMVILRMPYAAMISALIGFTALIPVFGAFIGTAIGAFLILMVDPMQAVWFVVFILVLQRIDGCFIYPKVVGKSVGLSSMWVMLAVIIGGSMGGALGLLIAVPISSILYCLLKESVNSRLNKNK